MEESDPVKARIREATRGSATPAEHYVRKIAEGVATIAAAFYPNPVIVRMSDFKTNEARCDADGAAMLAA
jgi:pyruvate,water dikinase